MNLEHTLKATQIALDQLAVVVAGFNADTSPELRLKVANSAVRLVQALTRDTEAQASFTPVEQE